uniref:Inositol polyphosphate-related phosphatase domain-containing protein n=1 Tax=Haptolina brevifila TaxID=156173 RepID=A0A7S2JSD0_9EUKA|mmetsp:Transcript_9198/g.18733  ORF Transcript_9198/g.18733 Transcript_9198/m.18733 type:complete len:700 (+) Transcript_9198:591-2690(+)|eukprot:CAMPEP_0174709574 /NCGR_PEP_ID=MMETSP1094-20130205/11480_1 /TAXON_ID=156173 /ORGANISM="Chrysochromulina brevifilum, Strain UTEX LB 985" /LENGTH=699 /DNA_ID=CAMNT_0015908263 /DNA_START=578 /DNA_END=2677 /DNA_ORIENTATION=+
MQVLLRSGEVVPGQMIGAMQLFEGGRRPATIVGVEDSVTATLRYPTLAEALQQGRSAAHFLVGRLVLSLDGDGSDGSDGGSGSGGGSSSGSDGGSSRANGHHALGLRREGSGYDLRREGQQGQQRRPDLQQQVLLRRASQLRQRAWEASPLPSEPFLTMVRMMEPVEMASEVERAAETAAEIALGVTAEKAARVTKASSEHASDATSDTDEPLPTDTSSAATASPAAAPSAAAPPAAVPPAAAPSEDFPRGGFHFRRSAHHRRSLSRRSLQVTSAELSQVGFEQNEQPLASADLDHLEGSSHAEDASDDGGGSGGGTEDGDAEGPLHPPPLHTSCKLPAASAAIRSEGGLRVQICTWNMNGKSCNDIDIASWLALDSVRPQMDDDVTTREAAVVSAVAAEKAPPDLVVIGCQEFVSLNAQSLLPVSQKKNNFERLLVAMLSHMHAVKYVPVRAVDGHANARELPPQLMGLLTLVLVREELLPTVERVHTVLVPTGLGGLSGNKGGIAFSLAVEGHPLIFVNMHLPSGAGAEAKEQRNAAFREVMRHLASTLSSAGLSPITQCAAFCFGDLNYRLAMSAKEVRFFMRSGDWLKTLICADQLAAQLRGEPGSAFDTWDEGEVTFRPTYKYDVGTSDFDTSSKGRAPAWCDRVLWRTVCTSHKVFVLMYDSCQNVVSSDHKPVKFLALIKQRARQAGSMAGS